MQAKERSDKKWVRAKDSSYNWLIVISFNDENDRRQSKFSGTVK